MPSGERVDDFYMLTRTRGSDIDQNRVDNKLGEAADGVVGATACRNRGPDALHQGI